MREQLCLLLARYAGKNITPELAVELVRELFPDQPYDPAQFAPRSCGSVVFAVESFNAILPELHPLHEEHWNETETFRHGLELRPDYGVMCEEGRAGTMLQITARKDGVLVGHLRLYLRMSRHTQTMLASEDALFLKPSVRGGRTAMRMIQYSEDVLKQIGVTQVRCNSKLVNNAARFMQGCGYRPIAMELVKFLD